jgi:predicted AAA+ superfamily ATPase
MVFFIQMEQFGRKILSELRKWAASSLRKPLILRGARQVGKTTLIHIFSKEFDQYIYLDLEKSEDADLFKRNLPVKELLQSIYLSKNITPTKGKTLLFIDEIQSCPEAVAILRYFYEEIPELFVISAGSLFEIMIASKQISFPVGRVQFLYIYPVNFEEFMEALGEKEALKIINTTPFPDYAFQKLLKLFHTYSLIGGMPEIVSKFRETKSIIDLNPIFQSLMTAYSDDVSKYAKNGTMRNIFKHCIENAPFEAGKRIQFSGFGNSSYKSREIGEALNTLERARLLYLLYPTTKTEVPVIPNKRKSPRLLFFDTGIMNFIGGLQKDYLKYDDLHSFYKGILAEHIVGQELLSNDFSTEKKPIFWVREKKQSSAEVDYVFQFDKYVIPIEVKAGKSGTLRSLHQFINRCNHLYAIRLYAGPLKIDRTSTPEGKQYFLLNLPYFLIGKMNNYVPWFFEKIT